MLHFRQLFDRGAAVAQRVKLGKAMIELLATWGSCGCKRLHTGLHHCSMLTYLVKMALIIAGHIHGLSLRISALLSHLIHL